jgi:uncharacterized protein (DUF1697 family)
MALKTYIALLRGINVSGRNLIPMLEARSLCAELGWSDVRSYIQSGNLLFEAGAAPKRLEADLEAALERRFGFSIPTLIRAASDWPSYVRGNPFPEASRSAPNRVMLELAKAPPQPDAVGQLQQRAGAGERIVQVGDAIWIHYPQSVARSKLSPALVDRLVGSPVTTRNWRTVLKLHEMAGLPPLETHGAAGG